MTALSHTASVKVLKELLGRLEAADGYDSRLTADIICALLAPPGSFVVSYDAVFTAPNNIWCDDGGFGNLDPYDIMRSLDAALALVERVLPGSPWEVYRIQTGGYMANLPDADSGYGPRPAIAVCIALLKALIANADSAGPQGEGGRSSSATRLDASCAPPESGGQAGGES